MLKPKINLVFPLLLSIMADFMIFLPNPAGAYVDPNTGNLVFQILFPVFTIITTIYLTCKSSARKFFNSVKDRLRWKGH
jgi:hypothetical protein